MSEISDQQLWDYIDGLLAPAEIEKMEHLLTGNEVLIKRLNSLMQVHAILDAHEFSNTAPSKSVKENILKQFELKASKKRAANSSAHINLITGLSLGYFITVLTFLFLFIEYVPIDSKVFVFNVGISNNIMIVPGAVLVILMCLFINNLLSYKRILRQFS